MIRLTDGSDRRTGATDFDRNLVVVAGAGTGKTSLLVERLLNVLLSGRASVEEVVVTTFTKKAASELKERVERGLVAVGRDEIAEDSEAARSHRWLTQEAGLSREELRGRAREISLSLDRATMSTLHSYAAEILRRHPVEAGMAPDFIPDAGEERRLLLDEYWPRFLHRELKPGQPREEDWRHVLTHVSAPEVEEAARLLIRQPQALDYLITHGYRGLDMKEALEGQAREMLETLEGMLPEVPKGSARHQMEEQINVLKQFLEAGRDGLELDVDPEGDIPKFWTSTYSRGLTKHPRREEFMDALKLTQGRLESWRKISRIDMRALGRILRAFGEGYHRQACRRGVPAMDDLLILTRNLLARNPHIRRFEADRVKMFLVDEFQDTDPIQYEILFLLSARSHPEQEDQWHRVPLTPGKVFIVGDPKQSIYRFRGADMEAYHLAVHAILDQDGEQLTLTDNFRSLEPVITAANTLFAPYIGSNPNRSVDPEYEPLRCARQDGDGPPVEFWSVTDGASLGGSHNREAEAAVVARAINEMKDRGVPQQDIALLFRATTKLPIYTRALARAGIDFVVEGGKSFAERPEVVEGLGLLRTLANPADPVAFVAALRWTFGGAPDPELTAYAEAGGTFSWQRSRRTDRLLADGAFPQIARTVESLRKLHEQSRLMPTDRFIHRVLLESELPLMHAAYFDGSQRLANLHKLAERTAAIARDRGLSLTRTLTVLEDNLNGDKQEWESPLSDEAVDAVRILTIHKAKGLEFPVVFLPDLPRTSNRDFMSPHGFLLGEVEDERTLGITFQYGRDVPSQRLREPNRKHEEAENKRLLYVAMTRAKDKLVIIASCGNMMWKEGFGHWGYDPSELTEGTLLGGVVHRLVAPPAEAPVPEGVIPDPAAEPVLRLERYKEELASRDLPPGFRTPSDHEPGTEKESPHSTLPPEEAKLLGDLMHRAMESWNFEEASQVGARVQELLDTGGYPPRVAKEATKMAKTLAGGDLPGHLASVEILGREVPLLFREEDGTTVHGYADLVYREGDAVVAADYKTDTYRGSAEEAARVHAPQLWDYAVAVQRGLGLAHPPQQEVIFLRTGVRVRLESTPPDPPSDAKDEAEPGEQLGLDF